MRAMTLTAMATLVLVLGCAGPEQPGPGPDRPSAPTEETLPGHLPFPFTADEIRDEWVAGLELEIRRWTPDAEAFETWTVVSSDADGVEISSTVHGADGEPAGDPSVRPSTWTQLRDHAAFPADHATRERVRRDTPLGSFEGWLYTVTDPSTGTVNELFFADALPGAPIFVHVFRRGELAEIFEQVERRRPEVG